MPITITPNTFTISQGGSIDRDLITNPAGATVTFVSTTIPSPHYINIDGPEDTHPHYALNLQLPPAMGTYEIVVHAVKDGIENDVTLTINVVAEIVGPGIPAGALSGGNANVVFGHVGDPLVALFVCGTDVIVPDHWILSNAPPGVEMGDTTGCSSPYSSRQPGQASAAVGTPSEPGIWDALVSAHGCMGATSPDRGLDDVIFESPTLKISTVRFIITGGLFLGWLHQDCERRDLQVLLRSGEVRSWCWPSGPQLTRGDLASFDVIFRDAPLRKEDTSTTTSGNSSPALPPTLVIVGDNNNLGGTESSNATTADAALGRAIVSDGVAEIWLTIRPANDPDEMELLKVGGPAMPETLGGNTVFKMEFPVTSDLLEATIEKAAREAGNAPGVALACVGELVWKRNGRTRSSQSFPVTIVQDISR